MQCTVLHIFMSSPGVPGVPLHPQILADHLTLFHTGGQIMPTTLLLGPFGFSDPPMALAYIHAMSLFLGKSL